jgi:hypothetical protein
LEKEEVILYSGLYNRLIFSIALNISSELLFGAITIINKQKQSSPVNPSEPSMRLHFLWVILQRCQQLGHIVSDDGMTDKFERAWKEVAKAHSRHYP